MDSDDANITEDTGNTSSTDANDKKKRMKNRKERVSRRKYPEPVTYHKHPNSNSNAIGNKENFF